MRLVLTLTLAAVLAGCGDSSSSSDSAKPAQTQAPPRIVNVTMRHNKFVPARIVAKRGELIRWTNDDKVAHTVTSSSLKIASEAINAGKTYSYRPTKAGSFKYFCVIHAGQTGVLVVR